MKVPYRLAELALDEDGIYWVVYTGYIAEQGGIHFGEQMVQCDSLQDALDLIEDVIFENLDEYKARIKGRNKLFTHQTLEGEVTVEEVKNAIGEVKDDI